MFENSNKLWSVWTEKMCFDGKDIWFAHSSVNILFCIDIINSCIKKIYVIPFEENYKRGWLYRGIVAYEDEIWLIPGLADRIVIFHKKTEEFDFIEITHEEKWKDYYSFYGVYRRDDFLYCMPAEACPKLIRINLKTKEQLVIQDFTNNYWDGYSNFEVVTERWTDDIIVKAALNGTSFFVIDLKEERICRRKIELEDEKISFVEMAIIEDYLYMCSYKAKDLFLRKIDLHTGEILKKIKIVNEDRFLRRFGKYIVVDYAMIPKYEIYNEELKLVYTGQIKRNISKKLVCSSYFTSAWEDFENGMLVCLYSRENRLCIYDADNMKLKKTIYLEPDISYLEMIRKKIKNRSLFFGKEYDLYTFSDFLEEILERTDCVNREDKKAVDIFKCISE